MSSIEQGPQITPEPRWRIAESSDRVRTAVEAARLDASWRHDLVLHGTNTLFRKRLPSPQAREDACGRESAQSAQMATFNMCDDRQRCGPSGPSEIPQILSPLRSNQAVSQRFTNRLRLLFQVLFFLLYTSPFLAAYSSCKHSLMICTFRFSSFVLSIYFK